MRHSSGLGMWGDVRAQACMKHQDLRRTFRKAAIRSAITKVLSKWVEQCSIILRIAPLTSTVGTEGLEAEPFPRV